MDQFCAKILITIFLILFKIIVWIYTVTTLPIYYLLQKPWIRLKDARSCGAKFIRKHRFDTKTSKTLRDRQYLEYSRFIPLDFHPLMKCNTVLEAVYARKDIFPSDQKCLAYREILEEKIQIDSQNRPIRIDGKILRKYRLSAYKWIDYDEFLQRMLEISRGLFAIGSKKNDRVAIYSETGLNFLIAGLACANSGLTIVTVFHTLTDQGLIHALNETDAKFIFVSFELLDRVSGFIQQCPKLRTIIYFEGPNKEKNLEFGSEIEVFSMTELRKLGQREPYKSQKPISLRPDELFGVMYTSGTTGIPKGVLISQQQMKEAALAIGQVVRDLMFTGPEHTYIAYLPQAHVLEMSLELFLFLGGVKIGYATPFTLNESAPGLADGEICDLKLLKPTVMTTVPLVLDRMQKEIYAKLDRRTPFSRGIFDFLIDYKAFWLQKGYDCPIVNRLLCSKVQEQFGGKLRYMVVGGAPLAPELQKQIKCALNVALIQGYGSTETSGGVFSMDLKDLSFGRIGSPLNGVHVRLIDWQEGDYTIEDKPNPRGELIVGGKMISSGYLNQPKLTSESFFEESDIHWFITSDIVEVYPDGTFRIIDRKKDIVKMLNGEFISLGKIEAILKSSIYVDNIAIVTNDTMNQVIALVVPNQIRMEKLKKTIKDNDEINRIVHEDLIEVGKNQNLKSIELPKAIHLCEEVWTPDNDLLTAAMKLKRSNLIKHYRDHIDALWNSII
ncbi:Long-chain-fatty-acid--CoA ligase 4 [Sarcoptes scabiei]|uniref:long-chain-fatty-acid--CoA ligase n=1 Tax=Sarcoptes scabiei TaxID=52283 RepID=A0A131ZYU4_SARSC|nr:Long-chain-fatty-acid--CoA ligase 4 [Sarcoptes scabiei]KPM03843.1 long chain fatty acid CoA ligase-like protein 3 [Sarcoptes scabiei]